MSASASAPARTRASTSRCPGRKSGKPKSARSWSRAGSSLSCIASFPSAASRLRVLRIHVNVVVGNRMDADEERPVTAGEVAPEAERQVNLAGAELLPQGAIIERDRAAAGRQEPPAERPPAEVGHRQRPLGVERRHLEASLILARVGIAPEGGGKRLAP